MVLDSVLDLFENVGKGVAIAAFRKAESSGGRSGDLKPVFITLIPSSKKGGLNQAASAVTWFFPTLVGV
jgi:hypothetical protein